MSWDTNESWAPDTFCEKDSGEFAAVKSTGFKSGKIVHVGNASSKRTPEKSTNVIYMSPFGSIFRPLQLQQIWWAVEIIGLAY